MELRHTGDVFDRDDETLRRRDNLKWVLSTFARLNFGTSRERLGRILDRRTTLL